MKTAIDLARKAGALTSFAGELFTGDQLERLLALHRQQVIEELAEGENLVVNQRHTRGWLILEKLPGTMMVGPDGLFGPVPGSTTAWVTTSERERDHKMSEGKPALEIFTSDQVAAAVLRAKAETRAEVIAELAGVKVGPVGYLAWQEGKPSWGEDCVCEDAVYPLYDEDARTSMPIYTLEAIAAVRVQEREAYRPLVEFVERVSKQNSSCGQCECNESEAEDLIDAIRN